MSDPGTGTSAVSTVTFVVPEDTEPQRLDRFLVSVLPEHSRSQIQKLIEDGHVTLVGRTAKANLLVRPGDQMSVAIPAAAPTDARPEDLPLLDTPVSYETLQELGSFGRLGRYVGQFVSPHNIAADSKGNVYVAEDLGGQRVQKFVFKGLTAQR